MSNILIVVYKKVALRKCMRILKSWCHSIMSEEQLNQCRLSDTTRPEDCTRTFIRCHYKLIKSKLEDKIRHFDYKMLQQFLPCDKILAILLSREYEKPDLIIKSVMHEEETMCQLFVNFLRDNGMIDENCILGANIKILSSNIETLSSHLQIEDFTNDNVQVFLRSELEPFAVIDDLFEWHLITTEEHDRLMEARNRGDKVELLLQLMRGQSEITWFYKFCHILIENGHQRVVDGIQRSRQGQYSNPAEATDLRILLGSTLKLQTDEETENSIRQQNIDDMNAQLSEHPDNTTGHVVDIRDGCIEFLLLESFQSLSSETKCQRCLQFLQRFLKFAEIRSVVNVGQEFKVTVKINGQCVPLLDITGDQLSTIPYSLVVKTHRQQLVDLIKLEHDEGRSFINFLLNQRAISADNFTMMSKMSTTDLKAEYVTCLLSTYDDQKLYDLFQLVKLSNEFRYIAEYIERMRCLECYRQSVFKCYEQVIDEIDTDIMNRTLNEQQQVPKFITDFCVGKSNSASRLERAKIFLQFVLVKGHLLQRFANVLATRTRLALEDATCLSCLGDDTTDENGKTTEFTFVYQETGQFVLKDDCDSAQASNNSDGQTQTDDGYFSWNIDEQSKNTNGQTQTDDLSPECYDMDRPICIISNLSETCDRRRISAKADQKCLLHCFRKLGFDVDLQDMKTTEETDRVLQDLNEFCKDVDCIAFVLLFCNHGNFAKTPLDTLENLYHAITEITSLTSRPKLFFIQACRGELSTKGNETTFFASKFAFESDVLVSYSSCSSQDGKAEDSNFFGSFYTKILIESLELCGEDESLQNILIKVNDRINRESHGSSIYQVTSLTKQLKFKKTK